MDREKVNANLRRYRAAHPEKRALANARLKEKYWQAKFDGIRPRKRNRWNPELYADSVERREKLLYQLDRMDSIIHGDETIFLTPYYGLGVYKYGE